MSPASSKGKIPRNQSAPHFAQDKRNLSTTFTPMSRVGSTLGNSIGSGSQLQVEGAGSAKGINLVVKPLARKDIFYSRSIYSIHRAEEEEGKDSGLATKHELHLDAARPSLQQAKLCQHSQGKPGEFSTWASSWFVCWITQETECAQ